MCVFVQVLGTVMLNVALVKSGPPGPLLATKTGPLGPLLAARSGPPIPLMVANSGPRGPVLVVKSDWIQNDHACVCQLGAG